MKKVCLSAVLALASLSAANIQDVNQKKSATPVGAPVEINAILQAARTVKNVAVNVQTMDPSKATFQEVVLTPEPATNMMIGSALVGLGLLASRRRRK